jgi:hypothetical protein
MEEWYELSLRTCFPYKVDEPIEPNGVLAHFKDRKLTRDEADCLLASIILKRLYIRGAMFVEVCVSKRTVGSTQTYIRYTIYNDQEPRQRMCVNLEKEEKYKLRYYL